MLETELEYLKPLVSHYWCIVKHQAVARNGEALCVVAPGSVVEPPNNPHYHLAGWCLSYVKR